MGSTHLSGPTAALTALVLCLLFTLNSCGHLPADVSKTSFAMGSVLSARVFADTGEAADAALDALIAAVNALDKRISATDPASELARLNLSGSAALSDETYAFVQKTLSLCRATDGAADPTLGRVTELWGFATDTPKKPGDGEITEALRHTGYDKVQTDDGERTVTLEDGLHLDPGAFGKGVGCDEAYKALAGRGCAGVVSLGGTVLVCGEKPDGTAWSVGIRDPKGNADSYCATLTLKTDAGTPAFFISTSGSYEKTFTENGTVYHHILDPGTGHPVGTDLLSVTAVSGNGCVSDALSTALFVRGYTDETRGWINEYLTGAVFIYADGGVIVTEGLRGVFGLTDGTGYRIADKAS